MADYWASFQSPSLSFIFLQFGTLTQLCCPRGFGQLSLPLTVEDADRHSPGSPSVRDNAMPTAHSETRLGLED